MVADITAKLRALIHGMLLQLPHGFPDDHTMLLFPVAFVGEFTEINAVRKNLV